MSTILPAEISRQVADLYQEMEDAYDAVAAELDFTCSGCEDNCCDSYFVHYTYTEWAYLWEGLYLLEEDRLAAVVQRSREYIQACERSWLKGKRPAVLCPLNENGLCILYSHRLMICRLHGIPSSMTRPDGQTLEFPGCYRCQQIVGEDENPPRLDRTELFRSLVRIEMDLFNLKKAGLPRIKKNIAEMIVQGPPDW